MTILTTCVFLAPGFFRLANELWLRFRSFRWHAQFTILSALILTVLIAGTKPETLGDQSLVCSTLSSIGMTSSAFTGIDLEGTAMSEETPELNQSQMISGYALTSIKTNNIDFVEFGSDSHIVTAWTNWALSDDVIWLPHAQMPEFDIFAGTSQVHDVFISSSGIIGLNAIVGGPAIGGTNGLLPTSEAKSLASVLNIPISIIPDHSSKVWTQTSPTSLVISFDSVYAGRNSSNEVSFQAEFFDSRWNQSVGQDIAYRYNLNSNTVNSIALETCVLGLQGNYPGYEQLTFTSSNTTPRQFELKFTGFGILTEEDADGDGISNASELYTLHTDAHNSDSDYDGLSDDVEITEGTNPNNPDSDGDGIPDGAEAPGQALIANTADDDADGLLDSWENTWLGSTGATDNASGDYNSDGVANIINLLTATDPAAIPPPGFALTNGVTSTGYDVWQISPAFSMQLPDGLTNILTRTLQISRTSPWQQFFISSDKNAGAPWSLGGLSLAWKAGNPTNLAQTITTSPASDSLWLELGTNLVSSLTFTLDPSRTNGFVYCPKPLYLIRWTPELTFTEAGDVKIVTSDNKKYATSILSQAEATALPFSINNSMPHNESTVSTALWDQISLPPYDDSKIFPVFCDNLTGHITALKPAEGELPASSGNSSVNVLLYNPVVKFNNGITVGKPFGELSQPYPLTSAATRRTWRNNAEATDTLTDQVEISLGVDSNFVELFVNGASLDEEETRTFGVMTLVAPAYNCGQECECSDDIHVDVTVFGKCIWHHCEPYHYDYGYEDEPCDDCDCDDDGPQQGSLKFRIKLGEPGYDQVSGYLWFAFETPETITTNIFNILKGPDVVVETENGLTSIISLAPDGNPLVRTHENITGVVRIKLYNSNSAYDHMWEITNPSGNPNVVNIIKSKSLPESTLILAELSETHTYDPQNGEWTKTDNLRNFTQTLIISGDLESQGWRSETTTLKDSTGKILASTVIERSVLGMENSAITRITWQGTWDGYNSRYLATDSLYWTDNQNSSLHGRLKLRYGDNTPWEYHFCDDRGRTLLTAGPLNGSAHAAAMENSDDIDTIQELENLLTCTAETHSYTPIEGMGDTQNSRDSGKPRKTEKYTVANGSSTLISREWHIYSREDGEEYSQLTHTAIRAASQNAAVNDAANQRTITVSIPDDDSVAELIMRGRPLSQQNPDGTLTTWKYDLDQVNSELIITTYSGTTASPEGIARKSTFEVEIIDTNYGHTLTRETYLHTGEQSAAIPLSSEAYFYNSENRLILTEFSDGTFNSNIWNCCHIEKSIARDGTVTAYNEWPSYPTDSEVVYLSQGQLPGTDGNCPGLYTKTDGIGREIQSIRFVTDANFNYNNGYAEQTTTTAYPFGTGNFSVTTDHLGIATTNITSQNGATNITMTSRAGITTTSTTIAGGASFTTKNWTDSVSGISHSVETKTETQYQPDGCEVRSSYVRYDDGEWITQSATTQDFPGRIVATTTPLGTTSNVYDSATGRVVKTSRTGSPDTLYVYNALGEVIETIVDVNANGNIDYSGPDQITTSSTYYQEISNDLWKVSSSAVYFQTNSTSTITASVSRVRMTGLGVDTYNGAILTAQSESEDWLGNITRSSTYTDSANATTWQVFDTPTSKQDSIQKSISGYPVQNIFSTAITNSLTYDGYSRQVSATDGRSNTMITAYNDLGQVEYIENAATNRTSFFYNGLGQRTMVSNALGQVSHTAYNTQGQAIATWGTSYPVAYQLDAAGRKVAMATTRSNTYANVNLNTLAASGENLSDCNIPALDITQWKHNETTGLLTNKVYADGNGTSYTYTDTGKLQTRTWARGITTTYSYGDLGQLTNVDYNDSTPAVTYTHDRLGRMLSASSSASTSTFHYDDLTLDYENQDGYIIDRKQDTFGQGIGYSLFNPVDPVNPVQKILYGYDSYNRFSSVLSVHSVVSNQFTYSYLDGTDLISGYTVSIPSTSLTNLTVTRSYESDRNLITSITNAWNNSVISSFDYINDQLGRRTTRRDYFNASTITNDFTYNIHSEVTGAAMGDDNYNYKYDPIGNREQSTVGSGLLSVTNTYTANQLNQYSSILNSQFSIPYSPSHDDDGNMTFSGSWFYTWDGENRLISASNLTSRVLCEYAYDYQSRRISKTTLTPNPDSSLITKYIWDDWNIIAELVSTNTSSFIPHNSSLYTWGLDLSGTFQGAGGVGGLLSTTISTPSTSSTYLTLSDANGNLTAYVDNTGAVKAHYEYNAFGEMTTQSGSMKDDFTHRFSTKPFDPETGLVVYQRRYYDPILGRWLSRDPIGIKGGLNEFGFVGNDGVNKVDPLGLKETNWKRIGFIHHGHVPHCIEWRDVGGGTKANHQKSY
jgi:RHS repeat-associated protein